MNKEEIYKKLITKLIVHDMDINTCSLCKNCLPCPCDKYTKWKGAYSETDGQYYPEMKGDCLDFNICEARENTPCEDCYTKRFGINFELDSNKIQKFLEGFDD